MDLHVVTVARPEIQDFIHRFKSATFTAHQQWLPMGLRIGHDMDHVAAQALLYQLQIEILKIAVQHRRYHCQTDFPDPENLDQTWLNQVHRWFTHTFILLYREKPKRWEKTVPALLKVNDLVHDLEQYVISPQRDIFPDRLRWLNIDPDPGSSNTERDPKDLSGFLHISEDWRTTHTQQHYDVVLSHEILGKTVLHSYMDNDDPSDIDTYGHWSTQGGLAILPRNQRQDIYRSKHFRSWAKDHGIKGRDLKCDLPIGNLANPESLDLVLARIAKEGSTQVSYLA